MGWLSQRLGETHERMHGIYSELFAEKVAAEGEGRMVVDVRSPSAPRDC